MLFYLLSFSEVQRMLQQLDYAFDKDIMRDTLDYYLARTTHGSTLSNVVHGAVMHDIDPEFARTLYKKALVADIHDTQGGTTPEAIHLGTMVGVVNILIRRYAGVDTQSDVINFHPHLPNDINELKLNIKFRGNTFYLYITQTQFTLTVHGEEPSKPIDIAIYGKQQTIIVGDSIITPISTHAL